MSWLLEPRQEDVPVQALAAWEEPAAARYLAAVQPQLEMIHTTLSDLAEQLNGANLEISHDYSYSSMRR